MIKKEHNRILKALGKLLESDILYKDTISYNIDLDLIAEYAIECEAKQEKSLCSKDVDFLINRISEYIEELKSVQFRLEKSKGYKFRHLVEAEIYLENLEEKQNETI